MGSLRPDTRCGWCGRVGATYIPDGIDPPVPLCGQVLFGCLFGTRDRHRVKYDALISIFVLRGDDWTPQKECLWEIARFL